MRVKQLTDRYMDERFDRHVNVKTNLLLSLQTQRLHVVQSYLRCCSHVAELSLFHKLALIARLL